VNFLTEDYSGGVFQTIMNHRRFDKIREFLEDQIITLSRKAGTVQFDTQELTSRKTLHDTNTNNCDAFIPGYSKNFIVFKRHL